MDRKKIQLLVVLAVLCLICVVSDAYSRGYISGGAVNEASNNGINVTGGAVNEKTEATEKPSSTATPVITNTPGSTGSKKTGRNKKTTATAELFNAEKAAIRAAASDKVRILVMTTGFGSYYHNSVKVTCGNDFTVSDGSSTTTYKAGRKVSFNMHKKSSRKKKFVISTTGSKRIKLLSVKRQDKFPVYRGTIEVKWTRKGFLMVNELPVEQYLYAVVPSEMSTGSHMEALKAQAVCARSYAYNQIGEEKYKKYNADLDDSTACQVYNNIPEDRRSRRAVDSTYGKVATDGRDVIVTYYFSTSWGCTADGQDVWNTPEDVPYLKSSLQVYRKKASENVSVDLSGESSFRDFIDSGSYETYDSGDEWYRWSVKLSAADLSRRIDSALYNCYLSNKQLVLARDKKGRFKEMPLESIGTIKKIEVVKRENSGLVTELVITGTGNTVKVCSQYNIRKVLAPVYEKISRENGGSYPSYSLLPSAAFYIDTIKTRKGTVFKITGGGFGHGAGLSQSGAAAMAKSGRTYKAILKHYFNGARIQNIEKVAD